MLLDPTTTEIIRNSLVYASEEMGIALRNTSYSPNIRERMDHSAAIFDEEGRLLAQAEHIPVHLGEESSLLVEDRSEEHTSELQSRLHFVCRLLLEKKTQNQHQPKSPRSANCC